MQLVEFHWKFSSRCWQNTNKFIIVHFDARACRRNLPCKKRFILFLLFFHFSHLQSTFIHGDTEFALKKMFVRMIQTIGRDKRAANVIPLIKVDKTKSSVVCVCVCVCWRFCLFSHIISIACSPAHITHVHLCSAVSQHGWRLPHIFLSTSNIICIGCSCYMLAVVMPFVQHRHTHTASASYKIIIYFFPSEKSSFSHRNSQFSDARHVHTRGGGSGSGDGGGGLYFVNVVFRNLMWAQIVRHFIKQI